MRLCLIVIAAACFLGCATSHTATRAHALTKPLHLCREGVQQSCRTIAEIEALLAGDLEILTAGRTRGGLQRASVLTLRSRGPRSVVFRAKWRAHATTTATNSPRFELAAYPVQKLFLEPREYVVPPTAPYCFPLASYRAHVDPDARETFPRAGCVYGVLSYWLEDVTVVADANHAGWFHGLYRHAFDAELFEREPAYRNSIARMNVLTYVIGHGDSHARNFVIARSEAQPVVHSVYSIDNSKSFTLARNRRIKPHHNWSTIQVPSLPRTTIERLRSADLSSLAEIAVLRPADGRLVVTDGDGDTLLTGVDWTDARLVIGLTALEIEGLRRRIEELLRRVDQDELSLY